MKYTFPCSQLADFCALARNKALKQKKKSKCLSRAVHWVAPSPALNTGQISKWSHFQAFFLVSCISFLPIRSPRLRVFFQSPLWTLFAAIWHDIQGLVGAVDNIKTREATPQLQRVSTVVVAGEEEASERPRSRRRGHVCVQRRLCASDLEIPAALET